METIIVPTDFSSAANNALEYAIKLAKFFDARIVLVNAYPVPHVSFELPFPAETTTSLHEISEEKLMMAKKEIEENNGPDLYVEYISDMGSPYEVIDAAVKTTKADMIVMGIVGEAGNLKERLIGSTAVTVARKQEIPTFIIPENVKYTRIHKISFACDLQKTEETDLVYVAKFFSKAFDAELEIVNVEDPEEAVTVEKATTYLYMENKLEKVNHKTVHLAGEDVAHELEAYFSSFPSDVIMLNPKKHNLFYYLFNQSVTHNLAFHTKAPILAIH